MKRAQDELLRMFKRGRGAADVDDETGGERTGGCTNQETGELFTCPLSASPLHKAAYEGDSAEIISLVRGGADINAIWKTIFPLCLAVKMRQLEAVRTLIRLKCDVNARSVDQALTVLHLAVSEGMTEIAKILCDNGANLNQRDNDGATPLMAAARNGRLDMVEFLVNLGADIDLPLTRGQSPLTIAIQNGYFDVGRFLLHQGAKVDMIDDRGNNAIFHAVKSGQTCICRLMLSNPNVNVNHRNKAMEYPITLAARFGNSPITDQLIVSGCDVNAVSRIGTPVYIAVEHQHLNVLKKLINAGADVGKVTQGHRLPLLEALHQHTPCYDVILELLRAGSDIDSALCACHDSPINMTLAKCNKAIITLLIQVDAKSGNIATEKIEEMKIFCPHTHASFIQILEYKRVTSLKGQCRKVIKRAVGTIYYDRKIEALPLPTSLKGYLRHNDIMTADKFEPPVEIDAALHLKAMTLNPVKVTGPRKRTGFRVPRSSLPK